MKMTKQKAQLQGLNSLPFYRKVLLIQFQRYKQKGLRIIWALVHLYVLVSVVPKAISIVWPTILSYFSNKALFIGCISLANSMSIILINLISFYVYQTNQKQNRVFYGEWTWKKNPQYWKSLIKQSIIRQVFTNILLLPLVTAVLQIFVGDRFRYDFQFPSQLQILKQGTIFFLFEDITNSNMHRLFHSKKLYWLHKKHHEYRQPVSISTQYANPIQLVFNNFAATAMGMLVLSFFQQIHIITAMIWVFFRVTDAIVNHSGYSFDWSIIQLIPFTTGSEFHSFHHTHNSGNIGSMFIFWDLLAGTYSDYVEYKINLMQNKKK